MAGKGLSSPISALRGSSIDLQTHTPVRPAVRRSSFERLEHAVRVPQKGRAHLYAPFRHSVEWVWTARCAETDHSDMEMRAKRLSDPFEQCRCNSSFFTVIRQSRSR
jgi:hypothetical protein